MQVFSGIRPLSNHFGLIFALAVFAFAGTVVAKEVSRAGDFMLLDQHGKAYQLHYYKDTSAVVLLVHSGNSATMQAAITSFNTLRANTSGEQKVRFFAINADQDATRESLQAVTDLQAVPVLMDEGQLVARELRLTQGGEILVLNPKSWQITYRGPIAGNEEQVKNVISALINNKSVTSTTIAMDGQYPAIQFAKAPSAVTYADTIAPLLQEKCADCHRPGGIGPWAMTGYDMIKGFAPMIKEVVLTRRMPPWHADPQINHFNDDLSLSTAEKQSLISWINAGAPRGKGNDPLTAVHPANSEWVLGEPDLIVEFPSFAIPATGVVDYQFFEIPTHLDKDVWVKAVQTMPGDRGVLHHSIVTFGAPDDPSTPIKDQGDNSLTKQQLMTFVPGNEHYLYPKETGLLLTKGSSVFAQMHYTTNGKSTTDKTRLGIYFADRPPENVLRHYSIINPEIRIPAGSSNHEESAYYRFREDAVIYSLFPHAHYRGASSKFLVRYPDGKEDLVLSVPHYDFNWQRYFQLQEPLEVPAGTMLIHRTTWDNSAANPYNPDPTLDIAWGEQSWEEMLYGGVSFRYKNSGLESGEWDRVEFRADVTIGYLDKNEDGKLVMDEVPEQMRKRMAFGFTLFDKNQNGGLEAEELQELFTPRPSKETPADTGGN